ncbi:MAG TPA: long-chain fatty acid--CoA ligase [Nocardioides sp.]|uniref:AMP-dependent synthetase/ligase n=1 Tax=Nocardioides sp. TaxID=35761 RepID=UPI002F413A9F
MTLVEERREIQQVVAGHTVLDLMARTVTAYGDRPAYSDQVAPGASTPTGAWRTLTWTEVHDTGRRVAAALVGRGLEPGATVAIMATNRIEHVVADHAALLAGGLPMSIYNTLSPEQVAYIAGHAEPQVVLLETPDHLERWRPALAEVASIRLVVGIGDVVSQGYDDERFVTWEDLVAEGRTISQDEVDARSAAVRPDDHATILYTSGTTGAPKGVVLSHANVVYECEATLRRNGPQAGNVTLSYLPYAHIAERVLSMYLPQHHGDWHVHLVGDPTALVPALVDVRPIQFFGVPRVWEKIRAGLSGMLAQEPNPGRRAATEGAMTVGREYVESLQAGRTTPPELQQRYDAANAAVLTPIKARLGLDRVNWAGSASAPMPVEVARFFAGLGLAINDIYGMTETCGAATACGPGAFRLGTVGTALPGIDLRIADDGEVLMRGPITTAGYHRRPDATAALLDLGGWVHSGDIGTIDEDGFLSIVDRKKELIITSAGKNIAPSNIESLLKESPIIGHALAFGDDRPYIVAVLTLDGEVAPAVARTRGIEFSDLADLAANPEIRSLAQAAVDAANARLSRPEHVKSFELLPTAWTAESEELTPTLKLKRRVVHARYADVIDRLYG